MRTLHLTSLSLLLGLSMACSASMLAQLRGKPGDLTEWSRTRTARYDGPECSTVLYQLAEIKDYNDHPPKQEDLSSDKQLLLLTCARYQRTGTYGHTIPQRVKVHEMRPVDVHAAFDDRHFDHLQAALMIAWTGQTGWLENVRDRRFGWHERVPQAAVFGMMKMYADAISDRELGDQLARSGVPVEARDVFLVMYAESKARIAREMGELGETERQLFVDVPAGVLRQRRAYFDANEDLYAELDALMPSIETERKAANVTEASVRSLTDIRSRYMARCRQPGCQRHPLYATITRELAQLHVARNDALSARAESRIFNREGTYLAELSQAIYAAQSELGTRVREQYDQYERAKNQGLDDETSRSVSGNAGAFKFTNRMLIEPKTSLPDFSAALTAQTQGFSGVVRSTRKQGGMIEVLFQNNKIKYSEAYGCRRTKRIARIHSDGRLEYEQKCKYRTKTRISESHPPVKLPAAEARHLQSGQMVIGVRANGEGRVVEVKRGDATVQLRRDPVR